MKIKSDTEYIAKTGHTIDQDGNIPLDIKSELVRCKDCKHFKMNYFAKVNGVPIIVAHCICCFNSDNQIQVHEDHYCSWGERKEI